MSGSSTASSVPSPEAFGREVLGPILAEFSLRLWFSLRFFPNPEEATLLFCARGGLRLRHVYESFLARTGLTSPVVAESLMVSRLVAARTCAPDPGDALLSELGREFEGRPMAEVALALTQRPDRTLSSDWDARFEPQLFAALLMAPDPAAVAVRQAIAGQDALFRRHLQARTGGRKTVILCDTGLYGSTVRLLRDGIPDRSWFCLQFARSNYKRLATPHFDCTRGLSIESDSYKPWEMRTSGLRFWQLIEAVLEPDLPSVRTFAASSPSEEPRSNLQVEGWENRIADDVRGLFSGVLACIETLDEASLTRIEDDAALAWRRFRRAVIWPGRDDLAMLSLADRSRDFGRTETVTQFASGVASGRAGRIRDSLWREGAVMRMYPRLGRVGLLAIELAQTGRALRSAYNGWRGIEAGRLAGARA
ncbi:glycosyltransferase [Methylobacterium brachythecii]|uniref:Uncharacterized protein n=1 Tax=Methylobacterium brachythecii TaxID=1176177 RepID=A0A7W6AQD2_9HYPH|nr:glycosyltransferase [Methylobacterium brachythecii]MBB3903932.1 hypothetical protein [Methylobacterium brachythecii]GLS42679.1 hypothetical protein GCM10007884_06640 [Methylobacterium brachythecii]